LDDKIKEAAIQAALQEAQNQPQAPQHVGPMILEQDWTVGVIPATKTEPDGKTTPTGLVHAICFCGVGQFHFIWNPDLAGQIGENIQKMAIQAKALESGLIVPETPGIFRADGS